MSRYIAITPAGVLRKGDKVRDSYNMEWTFQSVTHPRKLFVTAKDDPNGPDSWPNMASREYYANVLDAGIWDIEAQDWTFVPGWSKSDILRIQAKLLNSRDFATNPESTLTGTEMSAIQAFLEKWGDEGGPRETGMRRDLVNMLETIKGIDEVKS